MKGRSITIGFAVLLGIAATLTMGQQPAAPQRGAAPAAGQGPVRPPEPPLTPEQQKLRDEAQARLKLPMDSYDSVWLEELTDPEVRTAIATGGKTTGIILTGGTESNGPHLASGKHNYVLRATGEAIARKLGNALIAPIVTLETGNVSGALRGTGSGWPFVSEATYEAWLEDMGASMQSMGFKNILFIGDSGGNATGMSKAADFLNDKFKGDPAANPPVPKGTANFYHIKEYYDYGRLQHYLQEQMGVPELMRLCGGGFPCSNPSTASNGWADGIHEEYTIDALMALTDPETIRQKERVKAGRAIINGVPIYPLSTLIDNGRKLLAYRAQFTVDAIGKYLSAPPGKFFTGGGRGAAAIPPASARPGGAR